MARAIAAEFAKLKRSKVIWWSMAGIAAYSLLSFAVAPFLTGDGGNEDLIAAGGVWKEAVEAGLFDDTWRAGLLQAPWLLAGGMALLLFAFITAYLFGREFKEHTAVQTFTTPVTRARVVLSKMSVLAVWLFAWSLLLLIAHVFDLAVMNGFDTFEWSALYKTIGDVLRVTLMLYLTMPVFAWLAVWGRGYLRPMLVAVLLMGMGNGLATTDISPYWPWNVPLHAVGTSWMPIPPSGLVTGSWVSLLAVFVLGLLGTIWFVNRTDITG